jgi:hypothetical protein
MFSQIVLAAAVMAGVAKAQVTATGTMGTTNPPQVSWAIFELMTSLIVLGYYGNSYQPNFIRPIAVAKRHR